MTIHDLGNWILGLGTRYETEKEVRKRLAKEQKKLAKKRKKEPNSILVGVPEVKVVQPPPKTEISKRGNDKV